MVENFEFGTPKSHRTDSGNKVNDFEPDLVVLWVWATTVLPPRCTWLHPFCGRLHARVADYVVCAVGSRPTYTNRIDWLPDWRSSGLFVLFKKTKKKRSSARRSYILCTKRTARFRINSSRATGLIVSNAFLAVSIYVYAYMDKGVSNC